MVGHAAGKNNSRLVALAPGAVGATVVGAWVGIGTLIVVERPVMTQTSLTRHRAYTEGAGSPAGRIMLFLARCSSRRQEKASHAVINSHCGKMHGSGTTHLLTF